MAGQFQLFEFSDVSCANAALRVLWQIEPAIHRRTGNQTAGGIISNTSCRIKSEILRDVCPFSNYRRLSTPSCCQGSASERRRSF